jgi:flagellar motor switch protein FliG
MSEQLPMRHFTGVERAAVLMMLVGEEEAAAILQKLEPEEVRRLGSAMFAVADVSEEDVELVLDDFVGRARERNGIAFDPRPHVAAVMNRALGPEKAESVLARITPAEAACEIELLDWLDAPEIPQSAARCSNCCPTRHSPTSCTGSPSSARSRPKRWKRCAR